MDFAITVLLTIVLPVQNSTSLIKQHALAHYRSEFKGQRSQAHFTELYIALVNQSVVHQKVMHARVCVCVCVCEQGT